MNSAQATEEIFYSYWPSGQNKNGKKPVIILNAGGPGVINQPLATIAGGPMIENQLTDKFTKYPGESYFSLGDVLIPEVPAGVGFSTTNNYDLKEYNNLVKNIVTFFENLSEKIPAIDLKRRDIIF